MKSGVSLQQMLTEVKRQSESKEDYLIAPNRLRMESYGKEMFLHLSDDSGTELIEPMTITGIAHRQIGTHLRIPAAYYDRMREERPDLLAYNANTWFKQESSQRMLRTLDGSARAYLSNRYRRIDNIDIAGVTLPILGGLPDIRFESCQITESRMYIKAVNPRLQAEVSPGDITTIREMDGVKEVYGRRSVFDVSAKLNDDTNFSGTVDLISYDDFDLQCLKKDSALKRGSDLSKVFRDSNFVLATSDQDSTWKIGDTVQIGDETLTIAGLLKNDPFSENGLTNGKLTLITSDETFVRLTGEEGYSLVLIQTTGDVTDENVQAIQNSVDQTYSFQDKRDERTTGTYMAFVFCVYAFLAIIALVTVMNIVNSISMSVSARMKQYGAMRAVGMDERQMTKMIACEAFTYAVLGCVVGCAIGLPLSKSLYDFLIAGHFPSAVWQFPIISLGVILLFVSIAAIAAVYAPAKRIRNMSITATINEL